MCLKVSYFSFILCEALLFVRICHYFHFVVTFQKFHNFIISSLTFVSWYSGRKSFSFPHRVILLSDDEQEQRNCTFKHLNSLLQPQNRIYLLFSITNSFFHLAITQTFLPSVLITSLYFLRSPYFIPNVEQILF